MARYFTLKEANSLLPEIEPLLRQAISSKEKAEGVQAELQELTSKVTMSGGFEVDPLSFAQKKSIRDQAVRAAQEALQKVQELGCLIKDLDTGLIDFPALKDNREIYLCWRLGEGRIEYWHNIEDGFAGRRPIDKGFDSSGPPTPRPN